jgi:hypothetical protein
MTLTAAIIAIVAADLALIAVVAFVMSRAARLTPHIAAVTVTAEQSAGELAPARIRRRPAARVARPRRTSTAAVSARA